MASWIQFGIIAALLLWIVRRQPTPSAFDATINDLFKSLDKIAGQQYALQKQIDMLEKQIAAAKPLDDVAAQ